MGITDKFSTVWIIEWVVAATTILGAIVIVAPVIVLPVAKTALASTLLSTPGLLILGICGLCVSIFHMYGLYSRRYSIRSAALFGHVLLRGYILVVAAIIGHPIWPWESSFILFVIVVILWVNQRFWLRLVKEAKKR